MRQKGGGSGVSVRFKKATDEAAAIPIAPLPSIIVSLLLVVEVVLVDVSFLAALLAFFDGKNVKIAVELLFSLFTGAKKRKIAPRPIKCPRARVLSRTITGSHGLRGVVVVVVVVVVVEGGDNGGGNEVPMSRAAWCAISGNAGPNTLQNGDACSSARAPPGPLTYSRSTNR